MALELQPLQSEDAPRCASIYFDAFQNPHSLGCWPRVPGIRAFWENMITDELTEAGSHWFKVVVMGDAGADRGKIIAFGKWQEPKPGKFPDTSLPQWPAEADSALCDETFGAWAAKHRELMQDRGHWCKLLAVVDDGPNPFLPKGKNLQTAASNSGAQADECEIDLEIVATDPAYQGKGAGGMIMRWGTERADRDGVEAYLEASPDAVPVYHKYGFREVDRVDTFIDNERVKATWYRNLYMIRPTKS